MKTNKRLGGARGGGNRAAVGQVIPHPPQLCTELRHKTKLRFITNAAFAGNITFQNLLDTINVALTAGTAVDLFWMARIRRIQIWNNGLTNVTQTLELTFNGITPGFIGDERMHTAMSMGVEPAYINARPSARALCGEFFPSSTAVAWFMDIPINSVVDIDLEFRNSFVGTAPLVQVSPAGATAGAVYLRGLDGQAAASSKFTPVGSSNVD